MAILDLIKKPIQNLGSSAFNLITKPLTYTDTYVREEATSTPSYPFRNHQVTEEDLKLAAAVLFGEVSNRAPEKQKLEAQTILNTAFNRMDEYAKRKMPKTLSEVLKMPNQYQAYGGKQFKKFISGRLDVLDKPKVDSLNTVLDMVRQGTLKNNIASSTRYHHNADESITATDEPLFK